MELNSDAFQIIIEEENNRTEKLLRGDPFNQTTIVDRKEKKNFKCLTNKKSMVKWNEGVNREEEFTFSKAENHIFL